MVLETNPQEIPKDGSSEPQEDIHALGGVSFIKEEKKPLKKEKPPEIALVQEELKRAGVSTTTDIEPASTLTKKMGTILRPLRTYKDDVAAILKKTRGSKISIQTAEAKRQKRLLEETKVRAKANLLEQQKLEQLKQQEKHSEAEQEKMKRERESRRKTELKEVESQEIEKQKNLAQRAQKERRTIEEDQKRLIEKQKEEKEAGTLSHAERQRQLIAEEKIKEEQARIRTEQQKMQNASEVRRQEATNQPAKVTNDNSNKNRNGIGTLLVSVLFVALGGGLLFGTYSLFFTEERRPPQLILDTLILAEKNVDVDITGLSWNELVAELTRARNTTSVSVGSIANLKPLENLPGTEEGNVRTQELAGSFFFERIAPNSPTALPRSFGDLYMLGLFVSDEDQMFLILKPTFYENTFAGMLDWEASMTQDLFPLFERNFDETVSSTDKLPSIVSQKQFQDKVLNNKDTRVLYDARGEIVLLYSFISRDTLIIANGKEAFLEVFKRMSAKKVSN